MATIFLSVVSAKRSMQIYARQNGACFNCEKPNLKLGEFQIDHIIARNGVKWHNPTMHALDKLCLLCAPCNSSKGKNDALAFYGKRKFAKLQKLVKQVPDDKLVLTFGDKLAQSKRESKFARLWRSGIYHTPKVK